ncbi:MAG: hypothetical protein KF901_21560 [Myxococcales bacterium]|nr:hypothetical protein [Myxococcales bacterium]
MERPVSGPARPLDVARAMVARGATRDAMVLLRGALARNPKDGDLRFALATLERGEAMPPGPSAPLDLALVDGWIREGHLVEALALLGGLDLGGPSEEWANLLGELLAPVPAHAEEAFVAMHRELLSGGACVALSHLEDRQRESALPGWAERRLSLLRWMLLDNAQDAPDDAQPTGDAPTALAGVLRPPFAERNLEAVLEAAARFADEHPDDPDARAAVRLLGVLVDEMASQLSHDLSGYQTVPIAGRPAAAMQLRMANLDGAASIYRGLVARQPGDETVRALADAVVGLHRLLEGRPVVDRSFPPPPRDVVIVGRAATVGASPSPSRVVLEPLPRGASPTILEPVPTWERAAEMFASTAPASRPPSTPPASSAPPRVRHSASELPAGALSWQTPSPSATRRSDLPVRSTEKMSAFVEPAPTASAPKATSLFDDRTENEDSDDAVETDLADLAETGDWSLDSATFDLTTKKTALEELDPLEGEATRAVANPLAVFEDETATRLEPDAPPTRDAPGWAPRPSRPTVPLGSSPPPAMPRSEVEMKRADDPDPTLYGPTTVVVHPIRPIGVGDRDGDDDGGDR